MHIYIYSILLYKVSFNLFGEKHGKSSRDQHFSVLSVFLKNAQYTKQLTCTQDVIEALEIEQAKSNVNRDKLCLKPIKSIFLGKIYKIYFLK